MSNHRLLLAEWIEKAEGDLTAAVQILKLGAQGPADAVCFHAQQCVEKYVKAMLIHLGSDFPKTHDLQRLVSLLPPAMMSLMTESEQEALTNYATVARYPGGYGPISLAEARKAVAIARRVRKEVRALLPPEALKTAAR